MFRFWDKVNKVEEKSAAELDREKRAEELRGMVGKTVLAAEKSVFGHGEHYSILVEYKIKAITPNGKYVQVKSDDVLEWSSIEDWVYFNKVVDVLDKQRR